ncbi:MAG: 1-(5-phosphoribosyl)-5-[(5-phosphoribosylamino)methylideneamino] imidazole-4-carboxamide isomerase [Candidatus Micrarchaeota archaeon]|nr:1-(5-phosphoribosyl)-5-[(5-phosphoribosylamino)methylideneamino] imidazole-4-carboxamide isomerase [Candidatus Micrarchaeota archaeon]
MIGAVPSIDIIQGKAARLRQGRQGTEEFFGNPLELAKKYENAGFRILHIVDLDAAFGRASQLALLEEIVSACPRLKIQWAGGMRSLEAAKSAFASGASRVVFGTAIVTSPDIVKECAVRFGAENVWASLDFSGKPPVMMVRGWEERALLGLEEAVALAEACGAGGLIASSVDADAMEAGPNLGLLLEARKLTNKPLLLAGGTRNPNDAKNAFSLGADGAIIGRALYDRKIGMEEWTCLQKE